MVPKTIESRVLSQGTKDQGQIIIFGHILQRSSSLEKSTMLRKLEKLGRKVDGLDYNSHECT